MNLLFILPVLILTLMVGGQAYSADFQKGKHTNQNGDFATALREWKTRAEYGDASAQYHLGNIYYSGTGVPQDYKTALKWFTLAAEQGVATAQSNLGFTPLERPGYGPVADHLHRLYGHWRSLGDGQNGGDAFLYVGKGWVTDGAGKSERLVFFLSVADSPVGWSFSPVHEVEVAGDGYLNFLLGYSEPASTRKSKKAVWNISRYHLSVAGDRLELHPLRNMRKSWFARLGISDTGNRDGDMVAEYIRRHGPDKLLEGKKLVFSRVKSSGYP